MLRPAPPILGSRLRGNDGRVCGNDVGVRGNDGLFTLTPGSSPGQALTLSHRGRGDVAPGIIAPLG